VKAGSVPAVCTSAGARFVSSVQPNPGSEKRVQGKLGGTVRSSSREGKAGTSPTQRPRGIVKASWSFICGPPGPPVSLGLLKAVRPRARSRRPCAGPALTVRTRPSRGRCWGNYTCRSISVEGSHLKRRGEDLGRQTFRSDQGTNRGDKFIRSPAPCLTCGAGEATTGSR